MSLPNIEFIGYQSKETIAKIISKARGFIFPGREDFGISLVEAQACGTPVIANGQGGACEIVNNIGNSNNPTGILFKEQTVESLVDSIHYFESLKDKILPNDCLQNAKRFSKEIFKNKCSFMISFNLQYTVP